MREAKEAAKPESNQAPQMGGYLVYSLAHRETGKVYVGMTANLKERLKQHCSPSSGCANVAALIQSDGLEAFDVSVLASDLDLEAAALEERRAIARIPVKRRLNMTTGGEHPLIPGSVEKAQQERNGVGLAYVGRSLSRERKVHRIANEVGGEIFYRPTRLWVSGGPDAVTNLVVRAKSVSTERLPLEVEEHLRGFGFSVEKRDGITYVQRGKVKVAYLFLPVGPTVRKEFDRLRDILAATGMKKLAIFGQKSSIRPVEGGKGGT